MQVILYPLMSEKDTWVRWKENAVTFCVDVRATKPMIKREVERLYEVEVEKVNTLIRD